MYLAYVSSAEPSSSINVRCRPLSTSDQEVKEIFSDDRDYDELVKTKGNEVFPDEPSDMEDKMVDMDNEVEKESQDRDDNKTTKNKNQRGRTKGSGNEGKDFEVLFKT